MKTLIDVATERGMCMAKIQTCTLCSYATEKPVVFRGPAPAKLMLIADAPGPTDEKVGKPLAGAAGRWLNNQFHDIGLPDLASWFTTYSVKCRPPEDSAPEKVNISTCTHHLRREVNLADPQWIVTLGKSALSSVGINGEITKCHGRPFKVPAGVFIGRWVFPTLHPMQVFRDEAKGVVINSDLSTLKRILTGNLDPAAMQLIVGRNGRLVPPS